jgi:hypothetical protein
MSCQHSTKTVEQHYWVRRENSQEIIAEAKFKMCLDCYLSTGTVHVAWDREGLPFEAPLDVNIEVAARQALEAKSTTPEPCPH